MLRAFENFSIGKISFTAGSLLSGGLESGKEVFILGILYLPRFHTTLENQVLDQMVFKCKLISIG